MPGEGVPWVGSSFPLRPREGLPWAWVFRGSRSDRLGVLRRFPSAGNSFDKGGWNRDTEAVSASWFTSDAMNRQDEQDGQDVLELFIPVNPVHPVWIGLWIGSYRWLQFLDGREFSRPKKGRCIQVFSLAMQVEEGSP